jgi:hypothetical protein
VRKDDERFEVGELEEEVKSDGFNRVGEVCGPAVSRVALSKDRKVERRSMRLTRVGRMHRRSTAKVADSWPNSTLPIE